MPVPTSPTEGTPEQIDEGETMNLVEENGKLREALHECQKLHIARQFRIRRMVHDFRSPIASALSFLSGLESSHSVSEMQADVPQTCLAIFQEGAYLRERFTHLNSAINETLRVFASDEPEAILAPRRVEDRLGHFLDDIEFAFRRRFDAAKKQLEIDICDVPWDAAISIDTGMITEILENLLSNALEHGGETVQLVVKKDPEAKPGTLQFIVSDNGAGIDKAILEFLKPDAEGLAPKHDASATRGFGLSIAKLLAEAHGGKLSYEKGQPPSPWVTHFVVTLSDVMLEN